MVVVLLLCAPSLTVAQTGAPVRLSLRDVLALISTEHPIVRAGAATIEMARARAVAMRRYPNPNVEVERLRSDGVDNLAFVQPIRWPSESAALHGIGDAGIAGGEATARRDLADVQLKVARLFVDALREIRSVELSAEAESVTVVGLSIVEQARELGQVGDLAVLQAQVSRDAGYRERLDAVARRDAAARNLAVAIGLEPGTPLELDDDLAALALVSAPESALARAARSDPEAARLASEAVRAHYEGRALRARRWPSLGIGPSISIEDGTHVGLSLELSLPLWNRLGQDIRAARADSGAAAALLEVRRRDRALDVLEASATLNRSRVALDALRDGELARARQAAALASQAMQQGGPYVTAWLTARQAYIDARRAELDLEWEAAHAAMVLRFLTGTLVEESPP